MSAVPPTFPPPAAAAQQPGGSFGFYYFVYLVLTLIPTALCLIFFILLAPRFLEIFRDFRTTLPLFTQWTMAVSSFMTDDFLWVPILLSAFAIPILPARLTQRQSYRPHRVMSVLIALILMLLTTLIGTLVSATAVMLPLLKLIQSVSGGDEGGRG